MNPDELVKINKLVDSVTTGERIVLFPPGLWSIIMTILLLIVSTVTLSGFLISIYGVDLEASSKAAFQFAGMLAVLLFVIIPGLMIFRGKKKSRSVMKAYAWLLVAGNLFLLIVMTKWPAVLSVLVALLAVYLAGSRWFIGCSEFYFLLKQKLNSLNSSN